MGLVLNYKNIFISLSIFLLSCVEELNVTDFSDNYSEYERELRIEAVMLPSSNSAIIRIDQSILITDSQNFSSKVLLCIDKLIQDLPKQNIINKSLDNYGGIIIVDDFINSPSIIDLIAPEHLHLQNESCNIIFNKIQNAGGVFLGEYSSEAFGDYIVGTNHVLPTFGSAKFSSGLGVLDFMKRSSYVYMNKDNYLHLANKVADIATIENLEGHKLSVTIRQKDKI